jgi:ABC-type glutathione transport system ATPase component
MEHLPRQSSVVEPPALEGRKISLAYPDANGNIGPKVVEAASFSLQRESTLALVGESGSGKSTLAKAMVKLLPVLEGSLRLFGDEVAPLSASAFFPYRKKIQLVFQDPWQALNPRRTVLESLSEPLYLHHQSKGTAYLKQRCNELLDDVHLAQSLMHRYPSELSGGQRQRVLIARALAVEPGILICDEPVSALDVSIQSELLGLLRRLQEAHHLSLLFISHDLAVVREVAHEICVLEKGTVVESGPTETVLNHPEHSCTRALLAAAPQWT